MHLTANDKAIFLLIGGDEMRSLYETALRNYARLVWFTSFDALIQRRPETAPRTIVLDLDAIDQPVEWALQQLAAACNHTDIIVLSSVDSSQLALACVRSGCADFLLKPVSPEELAWSLRKLDYRQDFLNRVGNGEGETIRAINQIAAANAPALVQLYATEYVKRLLDCEVAAWIIGGEKLNIACAVPSSKDSASILFEFPSNRGIQRQFILRQHRSGMKKTFFPTQSSGGVFAMGMRGRLTKKLSAKIQLIMEHSGVSLANLQKLDDVKQLSFVDDLTGLYNSRYLRFSLTNAVNRCKSPDDAFSILFIDVDHFKGINDSHGHLVGSEFLIAIARAIKHTVRTVDLVFRYGGDEFIILLHQTNVTGAREIAERIRKHIERRVFTIQGVRIQTTVTIGIATFPLHASDKDQLLKMADEAMYSAKRLTRNAVHLAGQ